jgi:phosphoglycolate phosphatase-like HAD superfamily hydrolase
VKYAFHYDPPAVADEDSEFEIQRRFLARLKKEAPRIRAVATVNGGKRTIWEAQRAKAEGMKKGEPDLKIHWETRCTAVLEFKARTGSLSPDQLDALNWYHGAGFPCGVFRSVDTAIEFVRRCGAPFLFQQEAA